jgi:hypothetical protein
MTDFEDCFIAEARRQGRQPTSTDMNELAISMAGSKVEGNSFILPSGHSLLIRSAVSSFYASRDKQDATDDLQKVSTLTERMRREIEMDRGRTLPSDWSDIRKNKTGITAEMMDTVAAANPKYASQLETAAAQK